MKKILFPIIVILLSVSFGCSKNDSAPAKNAIITTIAATGIRLDSALVTGDITLNADDKPILESGICYATTTTPDLTKLTVVNTVPSGVFTCTLSGLHSKVKYFARAYFKNSTGVTYGNEVSFTAASFPTVVGNKYFNGPVHALCADAYGNVYAGGAFFTNGDGSWAYMAKWDGSNWSSVGDLRSGSFIETISTNAAGNIYTAIRKFNTGVEYDMVKFDGSSWNDVGVYNTSNFMITASCTDAVGNVYAIGTYLNAAGKYFVAKWGPSGYSELGSFDSFPISICVDAAGNLYAAGLMNHGNNFSHFYIARWDGSAWSEVGDFNNIIESVCIGHDGNLLATGAFTNTAGNYYVAKLTGSTWSQVGDLGIVRDYYTTNHIMQMCVSKSGNIYAIGDYTLATGIRRVKKWDGNEWSVLATFNSDIFAICADPNDNVFVGGSFTGKDGLWYVAKCN